MIITSSNDMVIEQRAAVQQDDLLRGGIHDHADSHWLPESNGRGQDLTGNITQAKVHGTGIRSSVRVRGVISGSEHRRSHHE